MKVLKYISIFGISIFVLLVLTSSMDKDLFQLNKTFDIYGAVYKELNEKYVNDIEPDELIKRLKTVSYLQDMSQKAYGSELTIEIVQKAIANLERALISKDSPFDAFMLGDNTAISESAVNGYRLFKSERLNCIQCHSGFDFSDYSFQNNGTYKVYKDSGRALITNDLSDIGKFKVPTLRNIDLTFPYMHNGSFKSLEEVIKHYENGGQDTDNKSHLIKGFHLTDAERQNLLDFLSSLTEKRYLEMNKY